MARHDPAMAAEDRFEAHVRAAIMAFVHREIAFTPAEIAERLEGSVSQERVARLVKRVFDRGLLRPFGYRRTLRRQRTRQGVITTAEYAPGGSRLSRVERESQSPTRPPPVRPLGYLDLSWRNSRRLARQTSTLREQLQTRARQMVRTGELLIAVRALIGPEHLRGYLEREVGMSVDTARRLIRVSEVFGRHPKLESLGGVRPSVLYKLAEASFPAPLRDAILAKGGLIIDGAARRMAQLRVSDVQLAKRAFAERDEHVRTLQRALAASEGERAERLRAQLRAFAGGSMTTLTSEPAVDRQGRALEGLLDAAGRLAEEPDPIAVDESVKQEGIEALKRLLARLEAEPGPEV